MRTSWQLGSSLLRYCMDNPRTLDDSSSVQPVHPQTGEATAHHVTASDVHIPLPPRATCSPADVALEDS